jgi:hypothetical protein
VFTYTEPQTKFFLVENGPAAGATDAQQLYGFLIIIRPFPSSGAPVE